MKITVVIPVYNAERFLRKAVLSALEQPETGEVLLVEDNSPDNCLDICRELEARNEKVKLLRHGNGENRGASASRNLGIQNASCDYIAFLDADDFYLPGRFTKDKEIFERMPDIDGVYSAIGAYFYDDDSKERHMDRMKKSKYGEADLSLTTIDRPVAPEELFEVILYRKTGWIHCNGVTIKKTAFGKAGFFDEEMVLGEDTEFFFRLSYFCRLQYGKLTEAVAMRGVHSGNRTLDPSEDYNVLRSRMYMYKKQFLVMLGQPMSIKASRYILNRYLDYYTEQFPDYAPSLKRKSLKFVNLIKVISNHPHCLKKIV